MIFPVLQEALSLMRTDNYIKNECRIIAGVVKEECTGYPRVQMKGWLSLLNFAAC